MEFWNQIPPDKFDDMKPHEITARELQTQLVDLYDFLSIKNREILDTVNGDSYKLDSEGSYEFGRADGGLEILSGLYIYFFGGRAMLELDQMMEKKLKGAEK